MAKPQHKIDAALIYDGDCAFCTRYANKVREDYPVQPKVAAWQDIDLDRYGLTARQCHDAVQWVDYRGNEAGARAIGRLWQAQGGLKRAVAWMAFVWPFSEAAAWLYRKVAANRHRLPGGTAACEVPDVSRDLGEMNGDGADQREILQDHEQDDRREGEERS